MIYVATPSSGEVQAAMSGGRIACMTTPAQGNRIPAGARWCADNGRFGKGWPGEQRWWTWLTRRVTEYGTGHCLFAAAPDVVGDFLATWDLARPWLPKIRALGVPVAYVAQDGSAPDWLIPWGEFDVLFLGGTDAFKLGPDARALAAEAVRRGIWVHMGRVNTKNRLYYAAALGCSSADGTTLTRKRRGEPEQNLRYMLAWLAALPVTGGGVNEG